MIGWLYRMIVGSFKQCEHEWELVGCGEILNSRNIKVGSYRSYECKKCKKVKRNAWYDT